MTTKLSVPRLQIHNILFLHANRTNGQTFENRLLLAYKSLQKSFKTHKMMLNKRTREWIMTSCCFFLKVSVKHRLSGFVWVMMLWYVEGGTLLLKCGSEAGSHHSVNKHHGLNIFLYVSWSSVSSRHPRGSKVIWWLSACITHHYLHVGD